MDNIIIIENRFMCSVSKYSNGDFKLNWKRQSDQTIRHHRLISADGGKDTIVTGKGFILNTLQEWEL